MLQNLAKRLKRMGGWALNDRRKGYFRPDILSSVVISMAAAASSAAAQQSGAPAQPDASVADRGRAPEPAPASRSTELEEVVVTAQRRVETVQKSSLAISVLSGADLARQGVAAARDLTTAAPDVTIAQSGAFTHTNIRGAGDFSNTGLAQTAVAYSVDGVVIGQPLGLNSNFYDLARVEILKGPQGTLYGRNSTGGAVNLLTNRPTRQFEGYVTGEYGNYQDKRVTGALNTPLTDTLAVRGAFDIVHRNGYLSDGTDDDKRQSGRLQAYWQPSDRLNLRLLGDYSHIGGEGGGTVRFPRQPGTDPWTSVTDPINNAAMLAATVIPGLQKSPFLPNQRMDLHQWDVSAEMNAELGDFATLTLLPGYRSLKFQALTYTFAIPGDFDPQITHQTSVEARLGHQSDRIKWTLGGFYYNDETSFSLSTMPLAHPVFIPFFNTAAILPNSTNRSYAGFGEATYSLTQRLRVIGGARYTHDLVSYRADYFDAADIPDPASPYRQSGRQTYNAVTWRTGVEYDVAPQSLAYFTASRGFKAGGFFFAPSSSDNSYRPETIVAFDVGIRNRFFDNQLQVNVEAFYWKYRDQQFPSAGYTAEGNIAYVTRNIGSSDPRGFDLDVVWKPTPYDSLGLTAAYTRARFTSFNVDYPAALIGGLRVGPLCSVPATPTLNAAGFPVFRVNCTGAPLPATPEWTGTVNYGRVVDLPNSGNLALNIDATFSSSRYLSSDYYVPELRDGGYALWNADLTYTPKNDAWSISAFVRNATNHPVYQGATPQPANAFDAPGSPEFVDRTIGSPRTYGARATYRF